MEWGGRTPAGAAIDESKTGGDGKKKQVSTHRALAFSRRWRHCARVPSMSLRPLGFLIAALHHAGLATLTHTPSPMGFLSRVLDRPANERAYLLLVVGHPGENVQVPDITRKPLDEIATFL